MAERRMFTNKITEADEFTALPPTTQCLYFHLCMSADDDGFSNKIRNSMFAAHADNNDLDLLITKRFVIPFESGVVVIKHWRMHNLIRADRYHETDYIEEKARLLLKDNGAYTDKIPHDNQVTTICQPNDNQMETEYRLGKDSKGKNIYSDEIEQIIDYLNQVLGTKYRAKSKSTCEKIVARLKEGHTFEDFKTVIDKKFKAWGDDPKMAKFLRPETLFSATHFESYLNEIEKEEKPNKKIHNFSERSLDGYADLLKGLNT